jgi:hypothetical protein
MDLWWCVRTGIWTHVYPMVGKSIAVVRVWPLEFSRWNLVVSVRQ